MNMPLNYIGIAVSIVITLILMLFVVNPEYLFEVSMDVQSYKGVSLSQKNWITKRDTDGIVHFNLMGVLENGTTNKVRLEISPNAENKWYLQGSGYLVNENVFIGKVQLGSKDWPMKKDQYYSFRMMTNEENFLAQGEIEARAYKIYGTDSLLFILVTLLASVVQIITFSWRSKRQAAL